MNPQSPYGRGSILSSDVRNLSIQQMRTSDRTSKRHQPRPWQLSSSQPAGIPTGPEKGASISLVAPAPIGPTQRKSILNGRMPKKLVLEQEEQEKVIVKNFDNAHKVIQGFVTFKAKEQLGAKFRSMLIKNKAQYPPPPGSGPALDTNPDVLSSSDDSEQKDPLKDQFLNKLTAMNEKIKVYNHAFYDRSPNFIQVSPQIVHSVVSNRVRQLVNRRKQNVLEGIEKKSPTLEYEIKDEEIWDAKMQLHLYNLIMRLQPSRMKLEQHSYLKTDQSSVESRHGG